MEKNTSISIVSEIMNEFADLTGLSPVGNMPRRYLWTDAFAVCNFLELYRQTGDAEYKELALRLVDQVHTILGQHREDDKRTGWISGLDKQEGLKHPTIGGLRIGKRLNERRPGDVFDEHLEWERDGQYYHYLTKWMHALNCVSRVTGDSAYIIWAMELAKTAHARFTYLPSSGGRKRMYWKMSIDLSYPLVKSMGHLDPLDGFVTYNQLKAATKKFGKLTFPDLEAEIADMADICEGTNWVTDDPLGIGELLLNAFKLVQLTINGNIKQTDMLENLLDSSFRGLEYFASSNPLKLPAEYRLAFREFGLAIGLHAVQKIQKLIEQKPFFDKKHPLHVWIESLMRHAPIVEMIEKFWLESTNRKASTWIEHRDINMVMLATSLAPDEYLTL
ncbi:MAG: hypothetical protein OEZ31_10495 [Nitrospirota bacterium]|nr:hypothetical protein [Nitrospirota bacterium]